VPVVKITYCHKIGLKVPFFDKMWHNILSLTLPIPQRHFLALKQAFWRITRPNRSIGLSLTCIGYRCLTKKNGHRRRQSRGMLEGKWVAGRFQWNASQVIIVFFINLYTIMWKTCVLNIFALIFVCFYRSLGLTWNSWTSRCYDNKPYAMLLWESAVNLIFNSNTADYMRFASRNTVFCELKRAVVGTGSHLSSERDRVCRRNGDLFGR